MRVLLFLLFWAALPTPSAAQAEEGAAGPIPAGTQMRVSAPTFSRGKISGRVVQLEADTLFLARKRDGLAAIPISAITGAEVSRGVDRWKGALKGAGYTGLAAGTLLGLLVFTGDPNCDYCLPGRDPEAAAAGAVIGAVLFAPIGFVVGAAVGSERWAPVAPGLMVSIQVP